MTISALAAGVAGGGLALHVFSAAVAAFRCRRGGTPLPRPPTRRRSPSSSRLCGVEPFSKETLASIFALDYPDYEVVFCVADAADPIAPIARRVMAAHPGYPRAC